ncbi:MAG: hypothetical protein GY722_17855 [bacterium]|nr:hypothetical protein [bacterium]
MRLALLAVSAFALSTTAAGYQIIADNSCAASIEAYSFPLYGVDDTTVYEEVNLTFPTRVPIRALLRDQDVLRSRCRGRNSGGTIVNQCTDHVLAGTWKINWTFQGTPVGKSSITTAGQ